MVRLRQGSQASPLCFMLYHLEAMQVFDQSFPLMMRGNGDDRLQLSQHRADWVALACAKLS